MSEGLEDCYQLRREESSGLGKGPEGLKGRENCRASYPLSDLTHRCRLEQLRHASSNVSERSYKGRQKERSRELSPKRHILGYGSQSSWQSAAQEHQVKRAKAGKVEGIEVRNPGQHA